jgi:hypothetical protein
MTIDTFKVKTSEDGIEPGYDIVHRIDAIWELPTVEFEESITGKPTLSRAQIERLVRILELLQSEVATSLIELRARLKKENA